MSWQREVDGIEQRKKLALEQGGREIAAAPDPEARRRELEEQLASQRSPYARAESFGVHDLIDPRHTRPVLCDWIDWIQPQLQTHRGPHAYTIRP